MGLTPLPIDEQLPAIAASLKDSRRLVLEAPPGAGKTTRVPAHLLAQPWCTGSVLVSEPRRIAARLSARRVAEELGTKLGGKVGYQVRFEDKTTEETQLVYVTEGLLLRRLLEAPRLEGVSAIVLDEVHERSSDLDALIAQLSIVQRSHPELRLIYMSATLNATELCAHLGSPAHHRSEGRSHEVAIEYHAREDERPLAIQVRSAVRSALNDDGDILVFLPGAREIRQCEEALGVLEELEIVSLHGDLPIEQQAKAVTSSAKGRRVVLSTNVAESSLTIPSVFTVIDSGLARTAVFDPWSGVSRLETVAISQARCIQRSGRAGRVGPGKALRLYTRGQFQARPVQDTPELLRSDLSDLYLKLRAAPSAEHEPEKMPWLTAPSPEKWEQARVLLERLGAMKNNALTECGRLMAKLPLSPRLARMAVEASALGEARNGSLAAALLSERDIIRSRGFSRGSKDVVAGDSDLHERLERLEQWTEGGGDRRLASDLDLDMNTCRQVTRTAKNIETLLRRLTKRRPSSLQGRDGNSDALLQALLCGFPDRVAQRKGTGRELTLAGGMQATLDEQSCVVAAPLVLAVAADAPSGRRRKPLVRVACQLDADWLLDIRSDEILALEEFHWNAEKERVDAVSRLAYGKVTLDEARAEASPCLEAAEVLARAAIQKGAAVYDPTSELEALLVRLDLALSPEGTVKKKLSDEERDEVEGWGDNPALFAEQAVLAAALSRTNLSDLKKAPLVDEFIRALPEPLQRSLRTDTPIAITLRGGRRLKVNYERARPPWVESRLQDFFSMTDTPALLGGRIPLQLHLLAPNKRAVQVTTDLAGFWDRHYPELRKQLMRRYPKHLWPERGEDAKPPTPGRIR